MVASCDRISGEAMELANKSFPPLSLARALFEGYVRNPHKPMAIGANESATYADAYLMTNDLAWRLRCECGVEPGDTVVLAAPNLIAVPCIMAASQMCGARLVHLSPTLERDDFERCTNMVDPRVVVASNEAHCAYARELFPNAKVLSLGGLDASVFRIEDAPRMASLSKAWEFPGYPGETEIVLFSSGSTGAPKAIVNRASSFSRNACALQEALSLSEDDVLYVPVPFAHVFGIVGVYAALLAGATIVTSAKYRPETALSLIADTCATVHFGVSTMFLRELRANQDDDWDLSTLRTGLVGGASCPESVLHEFERRWGCRLMQSYGMTETAATLTVTPLELPVSVRARTVGAGVDGVRIELAPDTREILVKTPTLMAGVIQDDGGYRLDLDEEGWLHTGDVGAFDEHGLLSIVGRIKEMIIRGGVNIFPAEVEAVYQANRDVSECCLVGYDDPELGERTCLCAIARPGSDASTRELRSYAVGRIEKCKIPDTVLKMDRLPHLANGKIDRIALMNHVKGALERANRATRERER